MQSELVNLKFHENASYSKYGATGSVLLITCVCVYVNFATLNPLMGSISRGRNIWRRLSDNAAKSRYPFDLFECIGTTFTIADLLGEASEEREVAGRRGQDPKAPDAVLVAKCSRTVESNKPFPASPVFRDACIIFLAPNFQSR